MFRKLEGEVADLKTDIAQMEQRLHKTSDEGKSKEHMINQIKDEKMQLDQALSKLQHAKKDLENQHQVTPISQQFPVNIFFISNKYEWYQIFVLESSY